MVKDLNYELIKCETKDLQNVENLWDLQIQIYLFGYRTVLTFIFIYLYSFTEQKIIPEIYIYGSY